MDFVLATVATNVDSDVVAATALVFTFSCMALPVLPLTPNPPKKLFPPDVFGARDEGIRGVAFSAEDGELAIVMWLFDMLAD